MDRASAVIVDMDGTLAEVSRIRHHVAGPGRRDFDRFHAESAHCDPIRETVLWCEEMADSGHHIVVVTARMEKWRTLTARWLDRHMTRPVTDLRMRADQDFRPDFEVKRDIHAELTCRFDIVHACDDNPNVIRLWTQLGIPVRVVPGWSE